MICVYKYHIILFLFPGEALFLRKGSVGPFRDSYTIPGFLYWNSRYYTRAPPGTVSKLAVSFYTPPATHRPLGGRPGRIPCHVFIIINIFRIQLL